jgi:hypothetical protein
LSQVEVSVSSEVSALKAAYVEASGEIEANSRAFSNYSKKGNISSNQKSIQANIFFHRKRAVKRFDRIFDVL